MTPRAERLAEGRWASARSLRLSRRYRSRKPFETAVRRAGAFGRSVPPHSRGSRFPRDLLPWIRATIRMSLGSFRHFVDFVRTFSSLGGGESFLSRAAKASFRRAAAENGERNERARGRSNVDSNVDESSISRCGSVFGTVVFTTTVTRDIETILFAHSDHREAYHRSTTKRRNDETTKRRARADARLCSTSAIARTRVPLGERIIARVKDIARDHERAERRDDALAPASLGYAVRLTYGGRPNRSLLALIYCSVNPSCVLFFLLLSFITSARVTVPVRVCVWSDVSACDFCY